MADLDTAYVSNGALYFGFADGTVVNAGRVTGERGPAGAQMLSGTRAPSPTDGSPGDFWIDYSKWNLFGPKGELGWPREGVSLAWQPDRYRGTISVIENLARRVQELENNRTRWLGEYQVGVTYEKSDQVLSSGWLAIATTTTTDNPAPYPIGDPKYAYQGTSPTAQITAPVLIVGNEYTFTDGEWITGYRVFTVVGNFYTLTVRAIKNGVEFVDQVGSWEEAVGGWHEYTALGVAEPGDVLNIYCTIREPESTPVTFNGNWDYQVPNNEGTPLSGQILHANRLPNSFRVSKTDNDGVDRSADLATLDVGDLIDSPNITWSIQAITDWGAWIDFTIAPSTQDMGSVGVSNFIFSTNEATPITTVVDPGYWTANPLPGVTVQGFYSTTTFENRVLSDTAYGTDARGQDVQASPDWDLQAKT